MEDVDMKDFVNLLRLKNQLVVFSGKELDEIYKEEDVFLCFIDTIALLSEHDSAFLLFDEKISDKIYTVLQSHRFNCDTDIKEIINDIIGYLNGIKAYPKSLINILKNNYLAYQEKIRHVEFTSTDSMLFSIADDAVVFTALQEGNLDLIEDGDYYMMSLNYLIETCPEFFNDSKVVERACSLLDIESKNSKILSSRKKYVKETRNRLNDTLKREE